MPTSLVIAWTSSASWRLFGTPLGMTKRSFSVRSLMTHSSGFEDGGLGYLIANDSTQVLPIDVALEKHMPTRVRPPGALSSYSNYGAALAGLIVQDVSGVPFNDYIRRSTEPATPRPDSDTGEDPSAAH